MSKGKHIKSDKYQGTWKVWLDIDPITGKCRISASINKNGMVQLGNSSNSIYLKYDCVSEKQAWFLLYNIKEES
ncbi:hypothetical protein LCGC14_3031110, partial [marine sediment metagenome]